MTFTEDQWRKRQENQRAIIDAQAATLERVRVWATGPAGRDVMDGVLAALGPAPAKSELETEMKDPETNVQVS